MNQAILQRSCSLPLIIFRGSISLYTAVLYLINGVHYVYCKVVLSLISTLLSITSFQNLKTPHLKFLSHVLSCVTLITFMLFPFPFIYTHTHTHIQTSTTTMVQSHFDCTLIGTVHLNLYACQFYTVLLTTSSRQISPISSRLSELTRLKCKGCFYSRNREKLHELNGWCVTCNTKSEIDETGTALPLPGVLKQNIFS